MSDRVISIYGIFAALSDFKSI